MLRIQLVLIFANLWQSVSTNPFCDFKILKNVQLKFSDVHICIPDVIWYFWTFYTDINLHWIPDRKSTNIGSNVQVI